MSNIGFLTNIDFKTLPIFALTSGEVANEEITRLPLKKKEKNKKRRRIIKCIGRLRRPIHLHPPHFRPLRAETYKIPHPVTNPEV